MDAWKKDWMDEWIDAGRKEWLMNGLMHTVWRKHLLGNDAAVFKACMFDRRALTPGWLWCPLLAMLSWTIGRPLT